jgi:hypothetical protein
MKYIFYRNDNWMSLLSNLTKYGFVFLCIKYADGFLWTVLSLIAFYFISIYNSKKNLVMINNLSELKLFVKAEQSKEAQRTAKTILK